MAETARDVLSKIFPLHILEIIDRAILDGVKTADLYQVTIEMKQYTIQNVFVTRNLVFSKGEENHKALDILE